MVDIFPYETNHDQLSHDIVTLINYSFPPQYIPAELSRLVFSSEVRQVELLGRSPLLTGHGSGTRRSPFLAEARFYFSGRGSEKNTLYKQL